MESDVSLTAENIAIGDELLYGQVVNTNAVFIGQRLAEAGVELQWTTVVGDDPDRIGQALRTALGRVDVVVATGGLGPTHDDRTIEAYAGLVDRPLVENERALENIRRIFSGRGLAMSPANRKQALVPEGATVLDNPLGTAPGVLDDPEGKQVFFLPGVPHEMENLMETEVLPRLRERAVGGAIVHRYVCTTGIGESSLFELIKDVDGLVHVASLPRRSGVDLRVTVAGNDASTAAARAGQIAAALEARAADYVWGRDDRTLHEVVNAMLRERGLSLALAESCTGGLIAEQVTSVPGSSDIFERGYVVYSNRAKVEELGVPDAMLAEEGAVSDPAARAMAEGAQRESGADVGLAVTGVAGPGGGSEERPVGTVYVAVASARETASGQHRLFGTRRVIQERAAASALHLLRAHLEEIPVAVTGLGAEAPHVA
jgi:nicotinamide-nucleotide amidase